jgi:hypothetical protein
VRLTKGMFGSEFNSVDNFGLRCGQMRGGDNKIGHNAGWYNSRGEKLGWGDLVLGDLRKVQAGMDPGEFFITLSEHDSYWGFVKKYGPIGSMCKVDRPTEMAPGIEYVSERYRFAVTKDTIFTPEANTAKYYNEQCTLKFAELSPHSLLKLLSQEVKS